MTVSYLGKAFKTDPALVREMAADFDEQVLAYYKERWPWLEYRKL